MATTKSTTAKGLGWSHQKQRKRLLRNLVDGTECYWCGNRLFREPTKNWDGHPLEADHSTSRSNGGTQADRLLHKRCNASRGDGSRDHLRPALRSQLSPTLTTREWL